MTSTQTTRNAALSGIIAATEAAAARDVANVRARFRATGAGGEGVRSEIQVGRHQLVVDEPPSLGGDDAAPNPIEIALASLLSCHVVTYRFWAAKLDIPLEDVRIDVVGELDVRGFFGLADGVRPGLSRIEVTVDLRGPASAEDYQRLKRAVDEHCPILDLFRAPTEVETRLVTA